MLHRALMLLFGALMLSSCTDQTSGRYDGGLQGGMQSSGVLGSGAGFGQKAAILLPLTGPRADIGQVLLQAANLAVEENGGPILDVLDTNGSPSGAAAAAQAAIAHGDSVIVGPLTSAETAAIAPITQPAGIAVLAFTNDASQARPGIWTLGITPDQQIRRLVVAAQAQGRSHFAALLPDTDFGRAMAAALTKAIAADNLPAPDIRMHGAGMAAITTATRDLSDYADRRGPIDAKVKEARALGTADGRREAQELVKTPIPPPPFDTLLLADVGDDLQEIAAVLPYYDIDRSTVQLVGPALWAAPASGSASVAGAWYAAPDSAARGKLEQDYTAKYGASPPPLADLAFDAISVARLILTPRGPDTTVLTQSSGFVGADGWLMFLPDGHVRRGLAVFKIERSGPTLIDPAPASPTSQGS